LKAFYYSEKNPRSRIRGVRSGSQVIRKGAIGRVQKGITYWDKQNNDVPAPNYVLKVQEEIIKVEGL